MAGFDSFLVYNYNSFGTRTIGGAPAGDTYILGASVRPQVSSYVSLGICSNVCGALGVVGNPPLVGCVQQYSMLR